MNINFKKMGNGIQFNRQLSAQALEYLRTDGDFIIPEIKAARIGEPFAIDIQIRGNNELMVYRGNSCILTIKIKVQAQQIAFKAHKAYTHHFLRSYPFSTIPRGKITEYIVATMPKVKNHFYGDGEGRYQNMLCYKHGEVAVDNSPFIILDRECVVGFENAQVRSDIFDLIAKKYNNIRRKLQTLDPERYGIPNDRVFGNELDLLAIDKHCNLICIELKYGTNGAGIYWGPLQLAVYRELFNILNTYAQSFFSDIKELIEQKVMLGLLPENVLSYFKNKTKFNDVIPYLAIAEPNFRMNCWDKMRDIIKTDPQNLSCNIITINEEGGISP
jgi:hypothetical protein